MADAAQPELWRSDAPAYPCLRGKRVFVTGGGSGIGAGMVVGFARQGCEVGFLNRSGGTARELHNFLGSRGLEVRPFACDVRDLDALARTLDAFGPVDVLVNNAARDDRHAFATLTPAQWDDGLAVNLRHHFFATQAVAPAMIERGGGAVVNMGSTSAVIGFRGFADYVAAKGAVHALTKSLARELGPDGVRVNCLLPGWVATRRQVEDWMTKDGLAACLAAQSIKRVMRIADIVEPALFLASSAAAMLSGQAVIVDGGRC